MPDNAPPGPREIRAAVEARLITALGEPDGRAAVTFLGADRIEVLRFPAGPSAAGEADVVRYATLGMSVAPMADPADPAPDPVRGPRAELLLSVRAGRGVKVDEVLRPLAVFAAAPQVEGLVVAPGASLDAGGPLWPDTPFTAVLVAEPGGLVEDLELPAPADPVRFLPLLPMTPNEAAHKRVHGAADLQDRWLAHGTDLRDLRRRQVQLQ
jgi:hypothetical protein